MGAKEFKTILATYLLTQAKFN